MIKQLSVAVATLCLPALMWAQTLTYSSEIQSKADAGNAFAQSQLGWCYETGAGVDKNLATAYSWFLKAASQGDAYSMNAVGKSLWNGSGVSQDRYEALKWFEKAANSNNADESKKARKKLDDAGLSESNFDYNLTGLAEAGDDFAQYILGSNICDPAFKDSQSHVYDLQRGLQFLTESEKQGNLKARHNLAIRYIYGPDEIKNPERGARYLKENADAGFRISIFSYSFCFLNGLGVGKSDIDGIYWMTQAANKGYPDAMAALGAYYENGTYGLSKDPVKAVEWYRKGSDAGSAIALVELGRCYYYGIGVPKDFWKAENYFGQALNLGNQTARNNLEAMGPEMVRRFPQYLKDLKRRAAEGDGESQGILAGIYMTNDDLFKKYGVSYNPAEAARLITEAAKNGYRDSYYLAGMLYETGGLPDLKFDRNGNLQMSEVKEKLIQPDYARAVEFYNKCINSGRHERFYPMLRMAKAYYDSDDKLVDKRDYTRCVSLLNDMIDVLEQRDPSVELREAYLLLSKCYQFGRGVEIDGTKADDLLKKSSRMGDPTALKMLSTSMSPPQQQ